MTTILLTGTDAIAYAETHGIVKVRAFLHDNWQAVGLVLAREVLAMGRPARVTLLVPEYLYDGPRAVD